MLLVNGTDRALHLVTNVYLFSGIDLENIVYYKDSTHYFVMTAKKQSLLDKGVIINVCKMLVKPYFICLAQNKCEHLHKRCMLERVFTDLTSFKLRSLGSYSDVFRICFSLQSAQSFYRELKTILPKFISSETG